MKPCVRGFLMLLPVFACAGLVEGSTWKELAPLPYPRYFHRAVVGADGHVFALAGLVQVYEEADAYGVGNQGIVEYDPKQDTWTAGPAAEPAVGINRSIRHKVIDGKRVDKLRELRFTMSLGHEFPAIAGLPDGRIFWFIEAGATVFDTRNRSWGLSAPIIADSIKRRWTSPIPTLIRSSGAAAAGPEGRIYIVGGIGYPIYGQDRNQPPKPLYELFDTLEIYDPQSNEWSLGAPMRRARQLFAAAFGPDGRLYVFGGYGHVGSVRKQPEETLEQYEVRAAEARRLSREALSSVESYDPKTNSWTERAPMPVGLHGTGAALGADGRIYVIGGAKSYSKPIGQADVFIYDPRTNRWDEGPPLNRARYHHAVAAGPDGKIYVVGGHERKFGKNEPSASVEVLDTSKTPWRDERSGW